eukprot:4311121-Prymnesium_polylepis.2
MFRSRPRVCFSERESLLRRSEELGSLLLVLDSTAIDARVVIADQSVCSPPLDFLRVCGGRAGRLRLQTECRRCCALLTRHGLLLRRAKDWLGSVSGVGRRTS